MTLPDSILDTLVSGIYGVAFALVIIALALTSWRAARGPRQSDLFLAFHQIWQCAIALIGLTAGAFAVADVLDIVLGGALLSAFFASLAGYCARRAALHAAAGTSSGKSFT